VIRLRQFMFFASAMLFTVFAAGCGAADQAELEAATAGKEANLSFHLVALESNSEAALRIAQEEGKYPPGAIYYPERASVTGADQRALRGKENEKLIQECGSQMESARQGNEAGRACVDLFEKMQADQDFSDKAGSGLLVIERSRITQDCIVDAEATIDGQSGQPVVMFKFDKVCSRLFGELTSKNIGRQFAIVLNDEILTAPYINTPITAGQGIISGNFTTKEANELAYLLSSKK